LPSARSSRATSIGRKVWAALSANTSAVPRTNSAERTSAIGASPAATAHASAPSTTDRARFTTTTIRRRSSRSVATPAARPKARGGTHCTVAARDTSRASVVRDAMSRGPAASASP